MFDECRKLFATAYVYRPKSSGAYEMAIWAKFLLVQQSRAALHDLTVEMVYNGMGYSGNFT